MPKYGFVVRIPLSVYFDAGTDNSVVPAPRHSLPRLGAGTRASVPRGRGRARFTEAIFL